MSTQVFELPDLGEGLTEADLVQWLVAEGDTIVVDQPIAEVETAKALVEIPSPYEGTILTLHGQPGDTLVVGNPLVTIGDPAAADKQTSDQPGALDYREEERAGISTPKDSDDGTSGNVLVGYGTTGGASTRRTRKSKRLIAAAQNGSKRPAPTKTAPRVISPLVRQLAKRHEINIDELTGSGPQGVILRADVEAAIGTTPTSVTVEQAPSVAPARTATAISDGHDARSGLNITERVPIKGVRKMIAEQMVRSRTQIPEATAWLDVDVTELVDLREQLKLQESETAPSLLALIARFTTAALQRYPVMNSRIEDTDDGQEIVHFDGINLGIAAHTERGLVVPAVEHAEQLSARGLTREISQLVEKARRGQSTPAELTRGTFTLNNYGALGTDGAAAIINAPEVAILGVGRIMDRPWVVDGELAVRKVTELTLSFDHRVTDGGTASAFLTEVAGAMQHPISALADL